MSSKYDDMTQDDFHRLLVELVDEGKASDLFDVPDVYVAVAEHFNNEVLEKWEGEQENNRCDTCRVPEHDSCGMTVGCPCCDDTLRNSP